MNRFIRWVFRALNLRIDKYIDTDTIYIDAQKVSQMTINNGSLIKTKKDIKLRPFDFFEKGTVAIVVSCGLGWIQVFIQNKYILLTTNEVIVLV